MGGSQRLIERNRLIVGGVVVLLVAAGAATGGGGGISGIEPDRPVVVRDGAVVVARAGAGAPPS